MNRLQAELQRLHGADAQERALVLELTGPGCWSELAKAWRGVQADLDLPAPAIAVNGVDGYQLWFSLAQAPQPGQAQAFLHALQARYLADVPPERIRTWPAAGAPGWRPAVPPAQMEAERWSAFVASDLAPVFADEPWLDHPPGVDAQADLLSRVESTKPEDFERAAARLAPEPPPPTAAPSPAPSSMPSSAHPDAGGADPRRFLLSVMQDPSVDLRLRIEAARALLPFADRGGPS